MVRRRLVLINALLSTTIAFQRTPVITRNKPSACGKPTSWEPSLRNCGIWCFGSRASPERKPLDRTSSSNEKFLKKNIRREKNRSRKLNSEIFSLRKRRHGVVLAEKKLEEAITYMIEENKRGSNGIAFKLQKQLQQKQKECETGISNEKLDLFPDIVSFHSVISSHAKNTRNDPLAASRAIALLEKMKDLSNVFPHLSPTIYSYNAVMEAYCNRIYMNRNRGRCRQQLVKDQAVLLRLYQELQDVGLLSNVYTRNMILASIPNDSEEWKRLEIWAYNYLDGDVLNMIPDRKTYDTLFKVYSVVGNVTGADKMIRKLLKWWTSQGIDIFVEERRRGITQTTPKPSKIWFHCTLRALALSDSKCDQRDKRIQYLLSEMKRLVKSGYADLEPDTMTYNHILNVYANYGDVDLALNLMKRIEVSANEANVLDSVSYTTVIKTFATAQKMKMMAGNESNPEMAERATQIFERMRKKSAPPTILTYNTLIGIWVNIGTRTTLKRAEYFLSEIRYPDSVSYSTLIHGWSKTRLPEAGSRALELFKKVLLLPSNRKRSNFSLTILCNSVISAYAKSGDENAPEIVESLFSQLEARFLGGDATARPDKITFLGIFLTYAKTGISNAEERCDILLDRMIYYQDALEIEDLKPDRVILNAVLDALAKSQQPEVVDKAEDILTMMETSLDESLRPDIITYSTFIDCLTKCGEMNLQRADELLRFVEGTFRGGDETLKPNAVFYSAILQAWAKTATIEGAEKAETLLQRNIDLYKKGKDYAKPHTIVFNAVMDAIARSNMVGAGTRAEELLDEMESLCRLGDEDLRPSRRSFNAVILAYRNEGNSSMKAEEIFKRMEDMASSGRNEIRPDIVTYNNIIAAVVEDNDSENTADRAQALLDQMEASGIKPDGRTYSPVIEAWLRRNDEKGHALADAMLTQFLEKVEERKKNNNVTGKMSFYEDDVWNVINAYRDDSKRFK